LEGKGTVGVGTDPRTSREMLENAFVSGILSTGTDVVRLNGVPMPTTAFHSSLPNISTSVIITASHNPPADNGFKFFVGGREYIRSEEIFLESRVEDRKFLVADWSKIGKVSHWDVRETSLEQVKKFLLKRGGKGDGVRILVDTANGAACNYTPHLLHDMGFNVTAINSNPDGHFPGRPAEPAPRNLGDTMKMAADSDFGVTIAHDGDGDRIAVIDEEGNFIDQNRIIALFARDEVERNGGGTVVVSIDTSSVIDELVSSAGGTIVRAPLGSLQESFESKYVDDIIFASEPWKPIFMSLGKWMDGITGAGRISQMVCELGDGSCINLMKSVPKYPMLRENVSCPDAIKPIFLPKVKELLVPAFSGVERILEEDGIRIERNDGSYVLVRVSGTEPKARLYIGAKTQTSLDSIAEKARGIMNQVLEDLGQ